MKLLLILLFSAVSIGINAQEEEMVRILEDQASQDEAREAEEDIHALRGFLQRPLNINQARPDELSVFPFLSALQIEQLLSYRKLTGKLVDVRELQAVPGWDEIVVRKIIPFITIREPLSLRLTITESIRKGGHMILVRSALSANAGLLCRYQFNSPHMLFSVNLEKDAGEKVWQGKKGISFLSAHIAVRNVGIIKTLVIGDFLVNFGQGLMLWQGRPVRKTGMPILIKRQLPLVMPYRSNDENRYFKGLALNLVKGRVETAVFVSYNKLDANSTVDTMSSHSVVSSFLNTGIHRNEAELADKNAVAHFATGMSTSYQKQRLRLGVNMVYHSFSLPVLKADEPYNFFASRGKSMANAGLFYHQTWRNLHVFGEGSFDKEGDMALMNGIMIAADSKLDLAIVYRKIDKGYRAFFANAFTESTEPQNEHGIYTGFSYRINPKWTVEGYADYYMFPWLRYRVDAPSTGRDYLLQVTLKPDKNTVFICRYRTETKPESIAGAAVKTIRDIRKDALRIHLGHKLSREWEFRTRFEFLGLKPDRGSNENGFLAFFDWFWSPANRTFSLNFRTLICETSSYDSRIYAFENDVMYYNIVPAHYGRMARICLNGDWKVSRRVRLQAKLFRNFPIKSFGLAVKGQMIANF